MRSVDQLARELEVSRRTILRDLAVLRTRGFRITTESGRGGGVQLDPSAVLISSQLAADEVVALVLSVAAIRAAPWMPFAAGADRALSKIEAALPAERVKDLRRFMRRILIGDPSSPATVSHADTVDSRLLPAFEQALTQSRVLRFRYTDRHGNDSRRQIEPHGLLVRAPLWYIIAWDIDKNAPRLFRMDRIRTPRPTDTVFDARPMDLVTGVCPDAHPARATLSGQGADPPTATAR